VIQLAETNGIKLGTALATTIKILPSVAKVTAERRRSSMSKKERDELDKGGGASSLVEAGSTALVIDLGSRELAPTYGCRPGGNVRYKEMRLGDWLFTYSTNLNASDLCLPGRWCEDNYMCQAEANDVNDETEKVVSPLCCTSLVPYWRRRGSGTLELDECSHKVTEQCEAFIHSQGNEEDVIFQVEEYDMLSTTAVGTQISRGFYELRNDSICVSTKSYCSSIVAYRNFTCKCHAKYFTINIYNSHPTITTHMDEDVLRKALHEAGVDCNIQQATSQEDEEETPR